MMDYLRFKKMIMPFVIQVVFWIATISVIVSGVYIIVARQSFSRGLIIIILGPLAIRLVCEIILVFFRTYQTLVSIEENLEQSLYAQQNPLMTTRQNTAASGTKVAPLFDIITGSNKVTAPQESPPTS